MVIWEPEVDKKLEIRRIESNYLLSMLAMMDKKAFRNESVKNIWKRSGKVLGLEGNFGSVENRRYHDSKITNSTRIWERKKAANELKQG